MSQRPVLFRPSYRERKWETDDVEMAVTARRQGVRKAMELRRELSAEDHRCEPSGGMAVPERRPAVSNPEKLSHLVTA
jgi:hypothetical protein